MRRERHVIAASAAAYGAMLFIHECLVVQYIEDERNAFTRVSNVVVDVQISPLIHAANRRACTWLAMEPGLEAEQSASDAIGFASQTRRVAECMPIITSC